MVPRRLGWYNQYPSVGAWPPCRGYGTTPCASEGVPTDGVVGEAGECEESRVAASPGVQEGDHGGVRGRGKSR